MDRGTWWATVCGVAKSQTQLSMNTYHRLWRPGEFWGSVFFRKLKHFLKLFCVYFRKLSLGLGIDGAETGVEGWVMRPSGSLSSGPSWGFLYVLPPCILPVCIPIVSLGRSILPGSKVSSLEFLVSELWNDGEGNGNPLQYSCLENPMDGGVWWATAHGIAKSRTRKALLSCLSFIRTPSLKDRGRTKATWTYSWLWDPVSFLLLYLIRKSGGNC